MLSKSKIVALLVKKGTFCENEKIDELAARHLMGWAGDGIFFVLRGVNPRDYTECVMPSKRLKRWPIILGFGGGGGSADAFGRTIVDGLHRCAVANHRGINSLPAYVPCDANGRLVNEDEFWAKF